MKIARVKLFKNNFKMQHPVRKSYVDSRFGQLHFQVFGRGKPLILCHQSPSSLEMFNSAYSILAALGIQCIGIDTPGYGQSDGPQQQPTILDYAECVMDVIEFLNLENVSLLGHHTGACIVAELAVSRSDLVDKVILNGPPLLSVEERREMIEMIQKAPPIIPKKDGSHLLDLWNKRTRFTPGWTDLDAMQRGIVQMLRAGPNDIFGFRAAFEQDLEDVIKKITKPTMILTNTGDDIYFAAHRTRELRPDFEFFELQNGTHDIVDEQPNEWSNAVFNFIK